jgi:7,8-dihydropterin-6-yl-methyl-4-(beta-D-ribofuranosyl)aminobenzene 5'-phosphate synthase
MALGEKPHRVVNSCIILWCLGVLVHRRRATGEYNGILYGREEMAENFELILSSGPCQISDNIYFLGEIPRLNDFEAQKTTFSYMDNGEKHQDFIMDDTALAIKTAKGLVIVTGCSHAGICNIKAIQKTRNIKTKDISRRYQD